MQNVPIAPVEGVDPSVAAQVAQISVQIFAAIATKNYAGAVILGLQLSGLIASLFAPATTPTPAPSPAKAV